MKDPKTIDQQVQILINRGLIINNIELAKEFFAYYCAVNGIDVDSLPENNGALLL